jgi:hypothetical protein
MASSLKCRQCGEREDFLVRISSLATLVRDDDSADGLSIDISEKTPADYDWDALHCGHCGHEGPRQDFEVTEVRGTAGSAIPTINRPPSPAAMQQALEAFIDTIEATGGCSQG